MWPVWLKGIVLSFWAECEYTKQNGNKATETSATNEICKRPEIPEASTHEGEHVLPISKLEKCGVWKRFDWLHANGFSNHVMF